MLDLIYSVVQEGFTVRMFHKTLLLSLIGCRGLKIQEAELHISIFLRQFQMLIFAGFAFDMSHSKLNH